MLTLFVSLTLAATPTAAASNQAAKPEKMICRRIRQGATRVGMPKVCKTKAEWRQLSMQADRDAREELRIRDLDD